MSGPQDSRTSFAVWPWLVPRMKCCSRSSGHDEVEMRTWQPGCSASTRGPKRPPLASLRSNDFASQR